MNPTIEEIKRKIDITDYINSVVPLKRAGRNMKANCPFHDEKTPSFVVSPDRQLWRCFGDIISFVQKWENLTFYEALQELAEKTGVKLKKLDFEDNTWKKKERLLSINNYAQEFYHYILTKHKAGNEALIYLKDRGVSNKLTDTFKLGYSPTSWDSLVKFLSKKKFSYSEIVEAGLALRSQKGTFFDRFRGRLMFPIRDARDNVIGFSGRLIKGPSSPSEQVQAKYVNTPETLLYKKRETLYGITQAKDSIIKKKHAIITEGEFDMISCFAAGFTNTVAIKGSALTTEQLRLLKRYTKHLILALDSDFSGTQTARRAIKEAERYDFRVEIAPLDFAKDPDEAIQKDLPAFKKAVKNPTPVYDFIIQKAMDEHSAKGAFDKKDIVDDVLPFISDISNPILHSHYVNKLANFLEIDTSSIELMIRQYKKKKKRHASTTARFKPAKETDRYNLLQQYIVSVVFQNDSPHKLYENIVDVLEDTDFSVPAYTKLLHHLAKSQAKNAGQKNKFNINTFAKNLPPQLQDALDHIYLFDISMLSEDLAERNFEKSVYELKKLYQKIRSAPVNYKHQ
ncbi:MAG: DNA primase [Candidatus Paceibacterota bacterium]